MVDGGYDIVTTKICDLNAIDLNLCIPTKSKGVSDCLLGTLT